MRVGARIARPCRKVASRGGYGGCGKPFVSRHNPSGRPQACHLPLHRGGFGGCIRRVRSGNSACLPPAGHFSPRKSAENAPGAAAPGPPLGCAACIPGRGIAQAVTLHRAVPFHTTRPFPASRGPVESGNRYGYCGFHKGRMDCPGTGVDMAHGSFLHILSMFAVGARIARPCRFSGLSWRARRLRKTVCTAAPKAPLCKGGCQPPG